ncbi:hypothetical protein [Rothia kristinae]
MSTPRRPQRTRPFTEAEVRQVMKQINRRLLVATGIAIGVGLLVILLVVIFGR